MTNVIANGINFLCDPDVDMAPVNVGVGVVSGAAELVKIGFLVGGIVGGTDPPPGKDVPVFGAITGGLGEGTDPPPEEVGAAVVAGVLVLVTVVEFGEDVGEVTFPLEPVASARVARNVVPILQP
jgi:hypothetical protein